jgi:hypothetical protein
MEGLLAILIAAISLALFLQKNAPKVEAKSSFMNWDTWAKQNNWSFFPPNKDAPMTVIGTKNNYSVYIYARKYQNMVEDYRDETEIKVPLKFTIADGLLIHPWEGISNMPRNQLAQQMKFNRGSLDDSLCLETKDVKTTEWVITQNEYRDIFEQFIDQHPLNRIEQKTVVLRKESLSIEEFENLISNALDLAEKLDNTTIKSWKAQAEARNWELRPKNKGGHPSLKGVIGDMAIKIHVQDNYNPYMEMQIEFPVRFPKDVRMEGQSVTTKGELLREGFDGSVMYNIGRTKAFKDFQYNANIQASLKNIFTEFPKSYIKDRVMVIMFPGKKNDYLDKWLDPVLVLAELLLSLCPPRS